MEKLPARIENYQPEGGNFWWKQKYQCHTSELRIMEKCMVALLHRMMMFRAYSQVYLSAVTYLDAPSWLRILNLNQKHPDTV